MFSNVTSSPRSSLILASASPSIFAPPSPSYYNPPSTSRSPLLPPPTPRRCSLLEWLSFTTYSDLPLSTLQLCSPIPLNDVCVYAGPTMAYSRRDTEYLVACLESCTKHMREEE
ncbi:hypothetical protein BDQ17DRAFT_1426815 [Cyathus striatus]|nr:hypothetical protein BDQ17DRAFT_1426815 [Cyathus striatus]